jgi:hypothetical protein
MTQETIRVRNILLAALLELYTLPPSVRSKPKKSRKA